ncbi:MAG: LysM peptidoglycan-binding domain-containing protein, partial [Planktothrix sp.]
EFNGQYYDWVSYTLQSGDTLSQIALDTMGDSSAAAYNFIAQYNGIADPHLVYAGETIQIPTQVSAPTTAPTNGSNDGWELYTVQSGDTLSDIAMTRTGDPDDYWLIVNYPQNNIPNPDLIYPGDQIWVPIGSVNSNTGDMPGTGNLPETGSDPIIGSNPITNPEPAFEVADIFRDTYSNNPWLGSPIGDLIDQVQRFENGYIISNGSESNAYEYGTGEDITDNPVERPDSQPKQDISVSLSKTLQFEVDNVSLYDNTQGTGIDFDSQFTVKPGETWDIPLDMKLGLESSFNAGIYGFLSQGTADIGLSGNFDFSSITDSATGKTTVSIQSTILNNPYMSTYWGFGAGLGINAGITASLQNIPSVIPGLGTELSVEISNGFTLTAEELIAKLVAPGASQFGSIDLGLNLNTNVWDGNNLKADDTAGLTVNVSNLLGEQGVNFSEFLNLGVELGIKQESTANLGGFYVDIDNIDDNGNEFYVAFGGNGQSQPLDLIPKEIRIRPDLTLSTQFLGYSKAFAELGVGGAITSAFGDKISDDIIGTIISGIPPTIGLSEESTINLPFDYITNPFLNHWKTIEIV